MTIPSMSDPASPDVDDYQDLALVDLDIQDVIDNALATAAATFPEWQPREGNTEVLLIEALAGEAMEMVHALNQVPAGLVEGILQLFGVTRSPGVPPSCLVTFVVLPFTGGRTVPAGTTLLLDDDATDEPLTLITDADLYIGPDASSGTIAATGTEPTDASDGIPIGSTLQVLDALYFIDTATLASPLTGGRAPEDSAALLNRAVPIFTRLTSTLVLPDDITAFVAETALAYRVRTVDLYDPARPSIPPGSAPGYVTVAVAGNDAVLYTPAQLELIATEIRLRMHAGLRIRVVNANLTTINVAVRILKAAAADPEDAAAAAEARIRNYLDPQTWDWESVARINEIIAYAGSADGVDAVLQVTAPVGDVTLPGIAPLARAGTVTVTVEDLDD